MPNKQKSSIIEWYTPYVNSIELKFRFSLRELFYFAKNCLDVMALKTNFFIFYSNECMYLRIWKWFYIFLLSVSYAIYQYMTCSRNRRNSSKMALIYFSFSRPHFTKCSHFRVFFNRKYLYKYLYMSLDFAFKILRLWYIMCRDRFLQNL